MKEQILEEIGLTKGESKVYLTLLEVGETTTGKIIEEAQISAGKVYQILDKLIRKGLVSYIVKDKTKYFSASHPKRVLDLLHEKEKEIQNKEEEIKNLLPSMVQIYESKRKKHETTLFKGLKGIQTAIFEPLDNLESKDEILAMGLTTSKDEKYNILWEKWHREREKRKIKCKCLFSQIDTKYVKLFKRFKFIEIKILMGITPAAINIMKEKVLIFTYGKEPSCLSITNSEISKSFRTFFNTLWNIAKK